MRHPRSPSLASVALAVACLLLLFASPAQAQPAAQPFPDHELAALGPWGAVRAPTVVPLLAGGDGGARSGRAPRAYDTLALVGDVAVDPSTGVVDGTFTITLRAEASAYPDLYLLIDRGLTFTDATADGYSVELEASPYDVFQYAYLTFSPDVPAGEQIVLTVRYGGTLECAPTGPRDSQYCGMDGGLAYFMDGGLFPYLMDGGDPYRFDSYERTTTLRVPSGPDVLGAGSLQSRADDGTTLTTVWHAGKFSSGMTFIALVGDLDSLPVDGTTPPTSIGYVAGSETWVSDMAGWEQTILPYIAAQAGQPLPFDELTVFKLPEVAGFPGTATHSMVYLAEYYGNRGPEYFAEVLAHETVHLWWGILVAPTDISAWLVEGPAMFTQYEYAAETFHATEDRDDYLGSRYHFNELLLRYLTDPATLPDLVLPSDAAYPSELIESVTWAYYKSSAVLAHLQLAIGEAAFQQTLRDYAAECAYAACTTSDFRTAAEGASGRNLGFFFDQWVYGTSYPHLAVGFTQQAQGDGVRVSVTLTQDLNITLPLELLLTHVDGSREARSVTLEGHSGTFELDVGSSVRSVRPNPRHDAIVWSRSAELADPDFTGQVDGRDLIRCARLDGVKAIGRDPAQYATSAVDVAFDPRCDLNEDQVIDSLDLDIIDERFGTGVSP